MITPNRTAIKTRILLFANVCALLFTLPAQALNQGQGDNKPPAKKLSETAASALGDLNPTRPIGNLGQAWWQWAVNFTSAANPLTKTGAVNCSARQQGDVWYLVGNFGGSSDRTCTIPKNKKLFFPLLNWIYWTPEDCSDENDCRSKISTEVDKATQWTCTIDDVPCAWITQIVRSQSASIPLNVPKNSFVVTDAGYSPGIRKISIADGYWVMLEPLAVGQHTLHFTGATSFPFALDVTYHLTVQ